VRACLPYSSQDKCSLHHTVIEYPPYLSVNNKIDYIIADILRLCTTYCRLTINMRSYLFLLFCLAFFQVCSARLESDRVKPRAAEPTCCSGSYCCDPVYCACPNGYDIFLGYFAATLQIFCKKGWGARIARGHC
jgi:hypothetical protein